MGEADKGVKSGNTKNKQTTISKNMSASISFEEFCRMKKRKLKLGTAALPDHILQKMAAKKEKKRAKKAKEEREDTAAMERKRARQTEAVASDVPPDVQAVLNRRQQVRDRILERDSLWVDGTRTVEVKETEREREKRLKKEKKAKKKSEKKRKKAEEKEEKKRKKHLAKLQKQEQEEKLNHKFWKNADVQSFVKENNAGVSKEASTFLTALEKDPKNFEARLNQHKKILKEKKKHLSVPLSHEQKKDLQDAQENGKKMSAHAIAMLDSKFC